MSNYFAYSTAAIKEGISFRINLFTSLFGGIFRLVMLVSIWKAIYTGHESIAGYKESHILFYMVLATVFNAGGLLMVDPKFGSNFRSGNIIFDLVRPLSLPWIYFFYSSGKFLFDFFLKSIPTLLLGLLLIGDMPHIQWNNSLFFLLAYFNGCFLHYWLHFSFMNFIFFTKSASGVSIFFQFLRSFLGGMLVPIPFFPGILQKIMYWTPFPAIIFSPIRMLMGNFHKIGGLSGYISQYINVKSALIIEQYVWILIIYIVSNFIFKQMIKIIEIQGG